VNPEALLPVCPSLGSESLQSMISDPFCVVAPHADTSDTHSCNVSNDEHRGSALRVSFMWLGG
jgi:hypothetical protein